MKKFMTLFILGVSICQGAYASYVCDLFAKNSKTRQMYYIATGEYETKQTDTVTSGDWTYYWQCYYKSKVGIR